MLVEDHFVEGCRHNEPNAVRSELVVEVVVNELGDVGLFVEELYMLELDVVEVGHVGDECHVNVSSASDYPHCCMSPLLTDLVRRT